MHSSLEYYRNKTVIVTGAAGFIGSHLCDRLLELGADVVGVDNLLTGRMANIKHLDGHDSFRFIKADVVKDASSYLPADLEADAIFHFASPASPPRYQENPVKTYLVNVVGTHNLLQYLRMKAPKARFLFASTSEVYGDPLEHPQKESYWGNVNPNGPRSCYDEAKRMGETICGVHANDLKMDVRIVRIFNTYGPRMDPEDGRIIPNIITQSLKDSEYSVYGDGQQTRSYCYVSDLVEGALRLGAVQDAAGQTVNIGNDEEYTVLQTTEIIHKLSHESGSKPKLKHEPLPTDDPTRRKPDLSKAKELLEWEPQISFNEGLKPTIEYFKSL